eukprot:GHVP01057167.1.p1 GENE.GHVP01057167.1~~GHVP01057167.1.p1  ORF type:complete len:3422 (+),score=599.59 GHVP01057167.1:195-10268(+)
MAEMPPQQGRSKPPTGNESPSASKSLYPTKIPKPGADPRTPADKEKALARAEKEAQKEAIKKHLKEQEKNSGSTGETNSIVSGSKSQRGGTSTSKSKKSKGSDTYSRAGSSYYGGYSTYNEEGLAAVKEADEKEVLLSKQALSAHERRGNPMYGPVGKGDAGSLEVTLARGVFRCEQTLQDLALSTQDVLESIEISEPRVLKGPLVDIYAVFQYGVLPEGLNEMILMESNPKVAAQMKKAASECIEEVICDVVARDAQKVQAGHADFKSYSVSFEDSGHADEKPHSLRKTFSSWLQQIEIVAPTKSSRVKNLCPTLTFDEPTDIGDAKDFSRAFLKYHANWEKFPDKDGDDSAGQSFFTKDVSSFDCLPLIFFTFFQRSTDEAQHPVLGTTKIFTHQLTDTKCPFNRKALKLQSNFGYQLRHLKTPGKEAFFTSFSALKKYLANSESFSEEDLLVAIQACKNADGMETEINSQWSVRYHSSSVYFGEAFIYTRFIPPEENQFVLQYKMDSATEYRRLDVDVLRPSTDFHGAPLVCTPYSPNTQHVKKYNKALANEVPPAWKFEKDDYEDFRMHEQFTILLEDNALQNIGRFLRQRRHNKEILLEEGFEQWTSLQATLAASPKWHLVDGDPMTTIVSEFKHIFPRFLLEVWIGDEFCGEFLFPRLEKLGEEMGSKKLWRLTKSGENGKLTRWTSAKQEAINITGWVFVGANFRIQNGVEAKFSVAVRELRDISTPSRSTSELQPGSPQIYIYQTTPKGWKQALLFSPFEFFLGFAQANQAAKSMAKHWVWDEPLQAESEPDWKNYFSWDEPGKLVVEEREVSIPFKRGVQNVNHKLDFKNLNYEDAHQIGLKTWRLCKNGLPSCIRPWLWSQLTGGVSLKKACDRLVKKFESKYIKITNFYNFLVTISDVATSTVQRVVAEDVAALKLEFGFSRRFEKSILEIMNSIVMLSSFIQQKRELYNRNNRTEDDNSSVYTRNVNAEDDQRDWEYRPAKPSPKQNSLPDLIDLRNIDGEPIAYSKAISYICYHLLLDFDGFTISNEQIFYLFLALCSAPPVDNYEGSHSKKKKPKAAFHRYHGLYPSDDQETLLDEEDNPITRPSFADEIPYAVQDTKFLLASIEMLHRPIAEALRISGFHLEEIFYSCFTRLFAGYLPTPTLYRLWDLLFFLVWKPPSVMESGGISFASLQLLQANTTAMTPFNCCGGNIDIQNSAWYASLGSVAFARAQDLFDGSMGRRILVAFSYSLVTKAAQSWPPEPSAHEIKTSLMCEMAQIRDPTMILKMIEKGDFIIFKSDLHLKYINALSQIFIRSESVQLRDQKLQNRMLQEIVQPSHEARGHPVPAYISTTFEPESNAGVYTDQRYTAMACRQGLDTRDLQERIYPMIKYQALYATKIERTLPENSLGHICVKIDQWHTPNKIMSFIPTIKVSLAEDVQSQTAQARILVEKHIFTEACVFMFSVKSPPPYKIHVSILDETGHVVTKLSNGMNVRSLVCQGQTFKRMDGNKIRGPAGSSLWLSWYMYTQTKDMFLPPVDGEDVLQQSGKYKLGEGRWGDLTGFHSLHVDVFSQSISDRLKNATSLDDIGNEIQASGVRNTKNVSENGVTKAQLDDLFFFTTPNVLPFTEQLICRFGKVDDPKNFQKVINTKISLRELMASLVIVSRGTVTEKAGILFDIFGHHDGAFRTSQNRQQLQYKHKPFVTGPEAFKESLQTRPFMPEGCLSLTQTDPGVVRNSISLSETTALVQAVLLRYLVHTENLKAMEIASSIFEHHNRVPRLLGASLIRGQVDKYYAEPPGTKKNSSVSQLFKKLGSKIQTSLPGGKKVAASDLQDGIRDVTLAIKRQMFREAAESGFFGFNPCTSGSLEGMGIRDPWPGMIKQLFCLFSPTGDLENVHLVQIQIAGNGSYTRGTGGYYKHIDNIRVPFHRKECGRFGTTHVESNPKHPCYEAVVAFNTHEICIDKYSFITKFLQTDILSEPLRRASSIDTLIAIRVPLMAEVELRLPLSLEALRQGFPLRFPGDEEGEESTSASEHENTPTMELHKDSRRGSAESGMRSVEARNTGKAPPQPELFGATEAEEDEGPPEPYIKEIELSDGGVKKVKKVKKRKETHKKDIEDARGSKIVDEAVMGSPPESTLSTDLTQNYSLEEFKKPDFAVPRKMRLTIIEAKNLHNTERFGKMDPYVKVYLGRKEEKSVTKNNAGTAAEWNQNFEFDYEMEDSIKFVLYDDDVGRDDFIGEAEVTFEELREGKRDFNVDAQLFRKGNEAGILKVRLLFYDELGLTTQSGTRNPQKIEITVIKGEDLPNTDTFGKSDPYVIINLGDERQQTPTIDGGGSNPVWNSLHIFDFGGEAKIEFNIKDEDVGRDDNVGDCTLMVDDVLREWIQSEKPQSVKLPSFRKGKEAGFLHLLVDFIEPPKPPFPELLKIHIVNGTNLTDKDTFGKMDPYCKVLLGNQTQRTPHIQGGGSNVEWNTKVQVNYDGSQHLRVEVWDDDTGRDDFVGFAQVDIWKMLKIGEMEKTTEVALYNKDNNVVEGYVKLILKLYNKPKPPYPNRVNVIVHQAEALKDADTFGKMDPYVKVKIGEKEHRSETKPGAGKSCQFEWSIHQVMEQDSKSFPQFVTLDLYDDDTGRDDHIGTAEIDMWEMLLQNKTDVRFDEVELTSKTEKTGHLNVTVKFPSPPSPELCDGSKSILLNVISATNLYDTDWFGKLDPYCIVEMDQNAEKRDQTRSVSGTKNPEWNQNMKFPYEGEAFLKFTIMDEDTGKDDHVGTGEFDLWQFVKDHAEDRSELITEIPLYRGSKSAGTVQVGLRYVTPVEVIPEGIRVKVRKGVNLFPETKRSDGKIETSDLYICFTHGNNTVRGKTYTSVNPTCQLNDEELYVPFDIEHFNKDKVFLSIVHQDTSKDNLTSEGELDVWKTFPSIEQPWHGILPMVNKQTGEESGHIEIIIQLITPVAVPLVFGEDTTEKSPQQTTASKNTKPSTVPEGRQEIKMTNDASAGHKVLVFWDETKATMLDKIENACQQKSIEEESKGKHFYHAINLQDSDVDLVFLKEGSDELIPWPDGVPLAHIFDDRNMKIVVKPRDAQDDKKDEKEEETDVDMVLKNRHVFGPRFHPLSVSTFPLATTDDGTRTSPQDKVIDGELQTRLQHITQKFEKHPRSFVSVKNICWVQWPLETCIKAASQGSISRLRERFIEWRPACACEEESKGYLVSLLDFNETILGFDSGDFTKPFSVPAKECLLSFVVPGSKIEKYKPPAKWTTEIRSHQTHENLRFGGQKAIEYGEESDEDSDLKNPLTNVSNKEKRQRRVESNRNDTPQLQELQATEVAAGPLEEGDVKIVDGKKKKKVRRRKNKDEGNEEEDEG